MWRSVCQRKYIPFPRIRIQNDLRRKSGQKTRLAGGIQRARVAPFDSRGGKAKPFTYSRNAPPAYECGRARLPPTRSSLLLSSIPVSSRPFVRRRQRTAAPLVLFLPSPSLPPAALRAYARPPRDTHGSPSAVYPQSIKTACQHEYQKPRRRGVQRGRAAPRRSGRRERGGEERVVRGFTEARASYVHVRASSIASRSRECVSPPPPASAALASVSGSAFSQVPARR